MCVDKPPMSREAQSLFPNAPGERYFKGMKKKKGKKKPSVLGNCVKVILLESHSPRRYADLTNRNHSKNSPPLKFIFATRVPHRGLESLPAKSIQ